MANLRRTPKDLSMSISTQSLSDSLDGLSSFVFNYFLAKFPDGMFKETYIVDSLNEAKLAGDVNHKQKLPYIGMEFEYTPEQTTLGDIPYGYSNMYHVYNTDRDRYYTKILDDPSNEIKIYAIPQRIRVNYNFAMKFQTKLAAINCMNYITNNYEPEGMNYINGIRLPARLPKYFVDRIGSYFELTDNSSEDLESLRNYFLEHSLNAIFETKNLSSGTKDYIYEYLSNILFIFNNEASTETNPKNLVIEDATVNFGFTVEAWIPTNLLLEMRSDDLLPTAPNLDTSSDTFKFNLVIKTDLIPQTNEFGYNLIDIRKFLTDINTEIDILEFKDELQPAFVTIIEKLKKLKADIRKVFMIDVYENNILMPDDRYDVNFDEYTITTNKPDSNKTYALAIYGDMKLINLLDKYIREDRDNRIAKLDIY